MGSGVQLRGVPVGKVSQITFAWKLYPNSKVNYIIVVFEVEGDLLPLPPGWDMKAAAQRAADNGLRAMVKSQGVTGTSILALEVLNPKTYPPLDIDYTPRHLYIPSAPPQFTRLLDSLDKTLGHIQEVDFAAIGRGVTNTLGEVTQLVNKLGDIDFANLSTNADKLLVELKGTSARLSEAIQDVQKTITGMKLGTVSEHADGLIAELRETNQKLQSVLDKVGAVPAQQTVADLQQVLQNLNEVLVDLKNYPSGFIFGAPPQPVEGLKSRHK